MWISALYLNTMRRGDIDEYCRLRAEFTSEEWVDLLIRSMGYESDQFDRRLKLHFLIRLIPLCERNFNLVELGPRGTGKLKMAGGVSGNIKESIQRAYGYLGSKKGELGFAREIDNSDFHVEVLDLLNNKVEGDLGVAFFVAVFCEKNLLTSGSISWKTPLLESLKSSSRRRRAVLTTCLLRSSVGSVSILEWQSGGTQEVTGFTNARKNRDSPYLSKATKEEQSPTRSSNF